MYRYVQSFPASNNIHDKNLFNIYRSVINNIFNFLPSNLFATHIYDFKDNQKNIYTYKNGSLINRKEASRITLPSFQIEFTNTANNVQDTVLEKSTPISQYSIAYGINPEMRGYNAFYHDKHNVQMFSSDIFCRSEFNITITVQSLNDRNAMMNILDNNIRQSYGTSIENVKVQYLLPVGMIDWIREALFVKELANIRDNSNELTNYEISKMAQEIDNEFVNHLQLFSNGIIENVKLSPNDKDSEINLAYNRLINVYYKFNSQFSPGEGEKRGELYDKYFITGSGYIEYYSPIAFIVNIPAIIKGEWTKQYAVESNIPDPITGKIKTKSFPMIYVEERDVDLLKVLVDENDALLFEEREFLCDNGVDQYPIVLKMIEKTQDQNILYPSKLVHFFFTYYKDRECSMKDLRLFFSRFKPNDDPLSYNLLDQVLITYPHVNKDYFDRIFKIFVWKNETLLKKDVDYMINRDLNLILLNTDDKSVYSFKFYINKIYLEIQFQNHLNNLTH